MAATKRSRTSTSKRTATTPRKAPSRTPKPKAAQAAAVVDAAVARAPSSSKGDVVLVSVAKGQRVFHDARGRRRFIAGGERFEVDARTAKVLLADDTSFAVAVGLEPTDAGNPERLTTPALSGAVTTEDLGKGGRVGAQAEQAKEEAEMAKTNADAEAEAAAKAQEAQNAFEADASQTGTSPVDATQGDGDDKGDESADGKPTSEPGATVLT